MQRSQQIGANVDPLTRDYIAALVQEANRDKEREIAQLHSEIEKLKREKHQEQAEACARLNDMENILRLTPSSRRQLQRLVEMLKE